MNATPRWKWNCLALLLALATQASIWSAGPSAIPVVLDTDIGDDIDDTWALVMLLKSPELDLKLVTTTYGKAEYRARLIARLLETGKRTDIPIGLGAGGKSGDGPQKTWVADYQLDQFPGKVFPDGVQALIDLVEKAPQPITVISVGPSDTVAAALTLRPEIASKAYFVGMQGSVKKGYNGGPPSAEWNVKANVSAAQKALLAPWKRTTITPLDTCGLVKLTDGRYQKVTESNDPLVQALVENYKVWSGKQTLTESSVLFDTVAVYLAYPGAKPLIEFEPVTLTVTADGFTKPEPTGMPMAVAARWKSLDGYEDLLVKVLLRPAAKSTDKP